MSIRTIIEINHDQLRYVPRALEALASALHGTEITAALNETGGPVDFGKGVRIIAQRHHSEDAFMDIGVRGRIRVG